MNIIFIILWVLHILIWMFVLLAFINKKMALINIYIIIPIIYLIHILPIHLLEESKKKIYLDDNVRNNNQDKVSQVLIVPYIFNKIRNLFKNSFENPFSSQGMLIFGLLTSIYSVYGFPSDLFKKK
jgi:hypothetical protein